MENKEITSEDVLNLIQAKAQDPRISMADIFRKVDSVKPDYNYEMWKLLWMPLVLSILSVIGMLFFSANGEWQRISIITFICTCLWGIYILNKYGRTFWWIPILAVMIFYIVFSDTLSIKELMKYITDLL